MNVSLFLRLFCAALFGYLLASPGRPVAQGTTIPRTCGKAYSFTQAGGSPGTTALIGPGSVASPATPAQVNQVASNAILICGYDLQVGSGGTAALEYAQTVTTACDTGTPVPLSPTYSVSGETVVDSSPFFRGLNVPAGDTLCLVSTTAGAGVTIFYSN